MTSIVDDYPDLKKYLEEIHNILKAATYDTPAYFKGVLLSDDRLRRLVDTIRAYTHEWEDVLVNQAMADCNLRGKMTVDLILLPTAMKKKDK